MAQAARADDKAPFEVRYPNISWFDPVYVADEKGFVEAADAVILSRQP